MLLVMRLMMMLIMRLSLPLRLLQRGVQRGAALAPVAAAPAATAESPAQALCDMCSEDQAAHHCKECAKFYCSECLCGSHKKGASKSHKITDLGLAMPTATPVHTALRIFVGNLANSTKIRDFKEHLRAFNLAPTHIEVPRGKRFGLLTFATPGEAATAVAKLNESVLMGRQIFAREDRQQKKTA